MDRRIHAYGCGVHGLLGMGNAYTAVPGDIYSAYFNPAGLSSMNARQLSISLRYLSMDRHFKDIIFGGPVGPDASFALSWINAGTDEIVGRDLNGNATGTLNDTRNVFGCYFLQTSQPDGLDWPECQVCALETCGR